MTDLDYKNKKNSNPIPDNASHANDDDLYALTQKLAKWFK